MAEHINFWFGPRPWGPFLDDDDEESIEGEEGVSVPLPSPPFPPGRSVERHFRVPRVRSVHIPAPVGEVCLGCDEAIQEGDSGELTVLVSGTPEEPQGKVVPLHRECGLLRGSGHEFGLCSCTNYEGLTMRQAAIEVDKRYHRAMMLGRYRMKN